MTGHLRQALVILDAAITALPRRLALPTPQPSETALHALGAAEAAPKPPEGPILEGVRRRLLAAFLAAPHGEASPKDLRWAPFVLWHGEPAGIDCPGLLASVYRQAEVSARTLRNLIEAWLRDFRPDDPKFAAVGFRIHQLLQHHPSTRFDIWRNAQARFQLFNVTDGPHRLAEHILGNSQPIAAVLIETGFDDPLRAVSGYLRAVQAELLRRVPLALRGPDAERQVEQALGFLTLNGKLRFDEARSAMARGLLAAWKDGGIEPNATIRDGIKTFLLHQVGHPQLRPGRWVGAEEEAALMRRWLARASLQVFFRLIAEHALDAQWKYREAFWSACLEKGAISEAWLALATHVHAAARASRDLGEDFARLSGNVSSNHSVLLLRIGPLVLAEWSHDGKLRAWPAGSPTAPKLGCLSYVRDDFMTDSIPFPDDPRNYTGFRGNVLGLDHRGSANSRWQSRAAKLLKEKAGVLLTPNDWHPR